MDQAQGQTKRPFLTIGDLAQELGLPQHILRYWETRFPQLKPLQRAGNRRYYRPADADLARRINRLLNVEGYTIKGVQKVLRGGEAQKGSETPSPPQSVALPSAMPTLNELIAIRNRLAAALLADG